ncbi:MAG: mechanosensitive ion channel [Candidatus Woesearchaeota archaeon]
MNTFIINIITFINDLLKNLNTTLTRILLALIVFFLGFIVGKVLGKATYRILNDNQVNKKLEKKGIKINAEEILSLIVSYVIYFITILYTLEILNIANTLITFFVLMIFLLILISIFIALIDLFPNFIAGLYLYSKEKLEINNKVKIDNIEGRLLKKELFHLVIETKKGDLIYIPNSSALKSNIIIKK